MANLKSFIIIFIVAALMSACSSVDCDIQGRVTCNIDFQDEDGESYAIPYYLSVSIKRSIDGNDTTIVNNDYNINSLALPMSYVGDVDEYTITLADEEKEPTKTFIDKITISKTNKPYYEDIDCSPRYNHTITKVETTNNFIESFEIKNNYVTNNASVTNIILRIRPLE